MELATIFELSKMTGRTPKALHSWFCEYGFKRVKMQPKTRCALYSIKAYNELVDKVNDKISLKKADPSLLTIGDKIMILREQNKTAMAISKELCIDLPFVLNVLEANKCR